MSTHLFQRPPPPIVLRAGPIRALTPYYVARTEMGRPGDFSNLSDAELDAKIEALAVINKANKGKTADEAV